MSGRRFEPPDHAAPGPLARRARAKFARVSPRGHFTARTGSAPLTGRIFPCARGSDAGSLELDGAATPP
eukprot:14916005-Alexandrium_andersonii.AAC.1